MLHRMRRDRLPREVRVQAGMLGLCLALGGCSRQVAFKGTECFYVPDENGDSVALVSTFEARNLINEQLIFRVRLENAESRPIRSSDGRFQDPDGCVAATKTLAVLDSPWMFADTRVSIPADQIDVNRSDLPLTANCSVALPDGTILARDRVRFFVPGAMLTDADAEDTPDQGVSETTKLADSRSTRAEDERIAAARSRAELADRTPERRARQAPRRQRGSTISAGRADDGETPRTMKRQDAKPGSTPPDESETRIVAADRSRRDADPIAESELAPAARDRAPQVARSRRTEVTESTDAQTPPRPRGRKSASGDAEPVERSERGASNDTAEDTPLTPPEQALAAPRASPSAAGWDDTESSAKGTVARPAGKSPASQPAVRTSEAAPRPPEQADDGWSDALDKVQRAAIDAEASKSRRSSSAAKTGENRSPSGLTAAARSSSPASAPAAGALKPVRRYTVKRGDTLRTIASKTLGDSTRWREIFDINRQMLDAAGRLIEGMELELPLEPSQERPRSPE